MKKVLFVCDGEHFSKGVFQFAAFLNQQEKILLTGIFLPAVDYSRQSVWNYVSAYEGIVTVPELFEEDTEIINKNIKKFSKLCKENHVNFHIRKEITFSTVEDLLEETRYADLVLIGSEFFYSHLLSDKPSDQLTQVLHGTECPALLIPEVFAPPEDIIMTYDGSSSSMASIRQFSLLMEKILPLPVQVIYFHEGKENRLPNEDDIREYLNSHFSKVDFKILQSHEILSLNIWMTQYINPILVSGSYSRSWISRFFKKSFIAESIHNHRYPVFIYHGLS